MSTSASTGKAVVLYKLDTTIGNPECESINAEVNAFVSSFRTDTGSICDFDGGYTGDLATAWSSLANNLDGHFNSLSVDAQGILARTTYTHNSNENTALQDAVDRYDYIYTKYHESLSLIDFMCRSGLTGIYQDNVNSKANIIQLYIKDNDNSSLIIIAIVSALSLTTLGGYFFIRRRKER